MVPGRSRVGGRPGVHPLHEVTGQTRDLAHHQPSVRDVAFGAASAAGLTDRDTVYCLPPLHHASGLLTTLGATVVGRSRIALSNGVDAETFAVEVRRYGITVVSYTWTMMREIVRSENFHIAEHNPIRLFIGSGMPSGCGRTCRRPSRGRAYSSSSRPPTARPFWPTWPAIRQVDGT